MKYEPKSEGNLMRDTALKLESGGSHPTWMAGPSGDSGREDGMSRGPVGDSCTVQPSTRRLQGQLPATVRLSPVDEQQTPPTPGPCKP